VKAYWNHNTDYVLGSTGSGTLTVAEDERGLAFRAVPPETQMVRDLVLEPMRRGDVRGASFGFRAHEAPERARKAGLARLAEVQKADTTVGLPPPLTLSRADPKGQPRELVDAVLRADAGKLPQWVGADLGTAGYALARVSAVKAPAAEAPELVQLLPRYAQAWSAAEAQAYLKALERRFKARIESAASAATPAVAN
jgi:hypothetical protein